MITFEINGIECDLMEAPTLTVKASEIATMSSGAAYTNTITLPDTNNNRLALGNLWHTAARPNGAWIPCVYRVAGVDILRGSGQCRVTGIGKDGATLDIRGIAFQFFNLCDTTKLVDLAGWAAEDFTSTFSNTQDHQLFQQAIQWAIMQQGQQSATSSTFVIANASKFVTLPLLRTKYVIETIVNSFGYNLVQAPDLPAWPKYAMPFVGKEWRNGQRYVNQYTQGATSGIGTFADPLRILPAGTPNHTFFQQIPSGAVPAILDTYAITAIVENARASLSILAGVVSFFQASIEMCVGSNDPSTSSVFSVLLSNTGQRVAISYNPELNAGSGNQIRVYAVIRLTHNGLGCTVAWDIDWDSFNLSMIPSGLITKLGHRITPESLLPDWTCKEFLQQMLRHTASFIYVEEEGKNVSIISANEIAELVPYAEDWSDRLLPESHLQPYESRGIDYSGYSATNWLRFTDVDGVTKQTGDGAFEVETGDSATTTVFTSKFSPTNQTGIVGLPVATPLHWIFDNALGDYVAVDTDDSTRLLTIEEVIPNPVTAVTIGTTTTTVASKPMNYVATFGNPFGTENATLEYSASGYYGTVADWANLGTTYTVRLRLDIRDMILLQKFSEVGPRSQTVPGIAVPKYFAQLNGYFLIQQVGEWRSADDTCDVVITKVA